MVNKVKAAELTQAKSVNLQNGLTGKVSGLNVQTTNSGVFADTRITLRGIRSLNESDLKRGENMITTIIAYPSNS